MNLLLLSPKILLSLDFKNHFLIKRYEDITVFKTNYYFCIVLTIWNNIALF